MYKNTILIVLSFFIFLQQLFCQSIPYNTIIGKWKLTKFYQNGKKVPIFVLVNPFSYTFNLDRSYLLLHKSKVALKGKWKFNADSSKIIVFENAFTDNSIGTVSDHEIPILKVGKCELVLRELLYSEEGPGISCYKRENSKYCN